jgi:acetyl esterase
MPEPKPRSERLHPEVRAFLAMLDAETSPPIETLDPVQVRLSRETPMKMLGGEPAALGWIENMSIAGPGGDTPIRVYARKYAREAGGLRPALIYFHGGGFVIGSVETHDALCRAIAKESDSVVISVDYRLAPEHKFPAVEDALAATVWAAANAERLGIDARLLAVGGDSAGGNLATVVALRCRDGRGPDLAGQVMIYPVTDASSLQNRSHREWGEGYLLTSAGLKWFYGHYVTSAEFLRHPEVSPLLAANLSGLPPALIIIAEFDPLRDEGEAYAERLRQAGVPVTVTTYPGMIHGFVSMLGVVTDARRAIREVAQFIRAMGEPGGEKMPIGPRELSRPRKFCASSFSKLPVPQPGMNPPDRITDARCNLLVTDYSRSDRILRCE